MNDKYLAGQIVMVILSPTSRLWRMFEEKDSYHFGQNYHGLICKIFMTDYKSEDVEFGELHLLVESIHDQQIAFWIDHAECESVNPKNLMIRQKTTPKDRGAI